MTKRKATGTFRYKEYGREGGRRNRECFLLISPLGNVFGVAYGIRGAKQRINELTRQAAAIMQTPNPGTRPNDKP